MHLIADVIDSETNEVIPWPPVQTPGRRNDNPTSTPLVDLFSVLMGIFPGCERPFLDADGSPTQHFLPHLSVGQVEQTTIKETVKTFQENWKPIEFEVTELTFLARAGPNKPFQTIFTVPIGEN